MARFVLMLVLSSLAVACNASQAGESYQEESYQSEAIVVRLSESALQEIDAVLSQYLPERSGATAAVLITEVDGGDVVKEIVLIPEVIKNLSAADACYARFAEKDVWHDGELTTNVWCQAPGYNASSKSTQKLRWDKYRYNRYFLTNISTGVNCFTNAGTPNYTAIIKEIHDDLCKGSLP